MNIPLSVFPCRLFLTKFSIFAWKMYVVILKSLITCSIITVHDVSLTRFMGESRTSATYELVPRNSLTKRFEFHGLKSFEQIALTRSNDPHCSTPFTYKFDIFKVRCSAIQRGASRVRKIKEQNGSSRSVKGH